MKVPSSAHRADGVAAGVTHAPENEVLSTTAATPQPLDPSDSAHDVALAELRRLLAVWSFHEPGARGGDDPEELHQLRVTARRIDATLGLFKHQLPHRLMSARKTAKSVLRALGTARDLDVLLEGLARYGTHLPEAERVAAEPLRTLLARERERARSRMARGLDSQATRHWLETLAAASGAPAGSADGVLTVMPARVRQRFRRLRKAVRRLSAKSTLEDFHEVRRRAKQLRYATECGLAIFGKPAEELLKALRRLQDELGAQQDANMALTRLAQLAADSANALPPPTLFFMGRLAEHHARATQQTRRTLNRAWRKVRGKRWKALRVRLESLSAAAPVLNAAPNPSPVLADTEAPAAEPPSPVPGPEPYPIKH